MNFGLKWWAEYDFLLPGTNVTVIYTSDHNPITTIHVHNRVAKQKQITGDRTFSWGLARKGLGLELIKIELIPFHFIKHVI